MAFIFLEPVDKTFEIEIFDPETNAESVWEINTSKFDPKTYAYNGGWIFAIGSNGGFMILRDNDGNRDNADILEKCGFRTTEKALFGPFNSIGKRAKYIIHNKALEAWYEIKCRQRKTIIETKAAAESQQKFYMMQGLVPEEINVRAVMYTKDNN